MDEEGAFICYFCGGKLSWDSTEMAADVYPGAYTGDNTAMVCEYQCMKCGRLYEITDPSEEERDTEFKDYWE